MGISSDKLRKNATKESIYIVNIYYIYYIYCAHARVRKNKFLKII